MKRSEMNLSHLLRCKHRHTIDEHPACFAQGDVSDYEAPIPWYKTEGTRIGYIDIETDGLKADFSTMLSWCIKEKDGSIYYDTITKNELFDGKDVDKRLVTTCLDTLKHFKIIISYYGTMFDIPYLRSKALHYGLEFPSFRELYHYDMFYTVKSKLNLTRKSLDNTCDYLGIEGKTPISKEVWRLAKYGDPNSLQEVLTHNKGDVIILEELHNRLEPFRKWTKTSI